MTDALLKQAADYAATIRPQLHKIPELGMDLPKTRDFIKAELDNLGLKYEEMGGGFIVRVKGQHEGNKRVALRADMDALPIEEIDTGDKAALSGHDGKMHACGHDGHSALLLGTLKYLSETRNFAGEVIGVFQAGEETGHGAKAILEAGFMEKYNPDEMYGFHNWPGAPVGTFQISSGAILAGSRSIRLTVNGPDGHGGMTPMDSPIANQLERRIHDEIEKIAKEIHDRDPVNFPTVARLPGRDPVEGHANIASELVSLGTMRFLSEEIETELEERIQTTIESLVNEFNEQAGAEVFSASVEYNEHTPIVINSEKATQEMREVAADVAGSENVSSFPPITGAEDFCEFSNAMFAQRKEASFIAFGQGEKSHGLHTASYEFNDACLPVMINYCARLIERTLPANVRNRTP